MPRLVMMAQRPRPRRGHTLHRHTASQRLVVSLHGLVAGVAQAVAQLHGGVALHGVAHLHGLHLAEVGLVRLELVHLQVLHGRATVEHLQLRRHVVEAWSLLGRMPGYWQAKCWKG